ncbi:MAG: hypothetical protein HYW25_06210 [Candidatus Aenigmarchaeota archaeon]|nr:hypothetical protein [Candidatus Aenigmarchaeota archaeon]
MKQEESRQRKWEFVKTTIRIPESLHRRLRIYCATERITQSEAITRALEEEFRPGYRQGVLPLGYACEMLQ